MAFDRNGDMTDPAVMVLRVKGREDASDVEGFVGAEVVRVIRPR